jgi:hypothetical protein
LRENEYDPLIKADKREASGQASAGLPAVSVSAKTAASAATAGWSGQNADIRDRKRADVKTE